MISEFILNNEIKVFHSSGFEDACGFKISGVQIDTGKFYHIDAR